MQLWKRYRDEKDWEQISLEEERKLLEGWFWDVDKLSDPSAYEVFETLPTVEPAGNTKYFISKWSFKTKPAVYAWVKGEQNNA